MKKNGIAMMVIFSIFILGAIFGCSDTTVNVYEGAHICENAQDENPSQIDSSLGYYYPLISDNPSRWERLPVDQDGIIMIDYGGQIGRQYNTVTICQYALANYNVYLKTGEERYEKEFMVLPTFLRKVRFRLRGIAQRAIFRLCTLTWNSYWVSRS